jgi:DNA (cytosine-5)-methyltransferase 1
MNKTLKIASFFSGCGGMDLGSIGKFKFLNKTYKKLPTQIVFSSDFDKSICELYNLNFNHLNVCEDIRNIDSKDIPTHDILTGGFPCQSFSVVAQNPKRLGYKDSKGQLFFELCRILSEKKPKIFIAENVKGILSANSGEAFPLIIKEFEKAGYYIKYQILNASHFGVPQKRERVFIVGFRNKKQYERFCFPEPTTSTKPVPLKKVLEDEQLIDEKYFFSIKAVEGLRASKNSKLMNKGRAQDINGPCNTVAAHLAKVSLNSTDPVLCIDGKFRMFTPKEVASIQSFPKNYKLLDSKTTNYKALGNAVPPVVMWHLMNEVIKALEINV